MLHDIIYSLVVVTCHYTTGTFFPIERPNIDRPWDDNDIEQYEEEEE